MISYTRWPVFLRRVISVQPKVISAKPTVTLRHSTLCTRPNSSLIQFQRGYKKVTDINLEPSSFYGVNTNYGWFIIPKTHYGYDFTETKLNECIKEQVDESNIEEWPLSRIQSEIVDVWVKSLTKSSIPKVKNATKKAKAAREIEDLYTEQMREVVENTEEVPQVDQDIGEECIGSSGGSSSGTNSNSTKKPSKSKTSLEPSGLKAVHAWNYYVQLNTPKYKHLSTTEARRAIGQAWRDLSLLEKEKYKQQLSDMLKSGVSLYNGKTIPLEEKEKYLKRFKVFKERSKKRMLKRAMTSDTS
ncbi:uncharacterized protein KQ657_004161 [Scheffersomyces spartinae]|uniref:Uncharacterized protein n=1 Tax=Scheffersomyces spartinae TaxID=45513 RepID=A0A9P8AKE1_9ASCO|nr:uncharacterized protein KQ657_004161 [Scheffersomyces spartinae]KAG7195047.1 hypothetical protein KQ657_004161 [Scheffersomyces spartinae]